MKFPKNEIIHLLLIAFLGILAYILIPKIFSFFQPVVIAFIIYLIIYPLIRFLEKKIKINKKFGIIIITALLILVIFLLGQIIFSTLLNEFNKLIADIPSIYKELEISLSNILEEIIGTSKNFKILAPLTESLNNFSFKLPEIDVILKNMTNIGNYFIDSIKSLPDLIINIIFTILFTIVFILNEISIKNIFKKFFKNQTQKKHLEDVILKVKKILGGYVLAQIKLLFITFIVCIIGFSIMKIDYKFLLALIVSLLDMLPFFGTGTIIGPLVVISIINGNFNLALGYSIVYIITFIIRRSLEPKMVGDSIGVSSLFSLFCMFIGYRLIGLLGLIIGVPLGVLLSYFYEEHFFDSVINSIKRILDYFKYILTT